MIHQKCYSALFTRSHQISMPDKWKNLNTIKWTYIFNIIAINIHLQYKYIKLSNLSAFQPSKVNDSKHVNFIDCAWTFFQCTITVTHTMFYTLETDQFRWRLNMVIDWWMQWANLKLWDKPFPISLTHCQSLISPRDTWHDQVTR